MFFNIKDYLQDNDHFKDLETSNIDSNFFDSIMKRDIESLQISNLVKIEIICIAILITGIILLILGWLIYFNILDIKDIQQAMKLCIN